MLLSSLKIQITLCIGLSIGSLIEATGENPEKDLTFKVIASVALALLNLAPFGLAIILFKKRGELSEDETKASIGALYEHHNATKPLVSTYPIVFLLRRALFVMTTFVSYKHPSLQIAIMLTISLAYLSYISRQTFYMSPFQKRVEMLNEGLLLVLCHHFVLFVDPWLPSQEGLKSARDIGRSAIAFIVLLLAANTAIILAVNCRQVKLRVKKKLNERAARKRQELTQDVTRQASQNAQTPIAKQSVPSALN